MTSPHAFIITHFAKQSSLYTAKHTVTQFQSPTSLSSNFNFLTLGDSKPSYSIISSVEKLTRFRFRGFKLRSYSELMLREDSSLESPLVALRMMSRSFSISVSSLGFGGLPIGRFGLFFVDGDSSVVFRFLYVRLPGIFCFFA